jgi:hypothetical protein
MIMVAAAQLVGADIGCQRNRGRGNDARNHQTTITITVRHDHA